VVEDVLGNAVVEDAFPVDDFHLLLVERSGVVLEELDEGAGFRTFEQDLGLAFINAPTTIHGHIPWFEDVHFQWGQEEYLAVSGVYGRLGVAGPPFAPTIGHRSPINNRGGPNGGPAALEEVGHDVDLVMARRYASAAEIQRHSPRGAGS
jgi:hypothetical protein